MHQTRTDRDLQPAPARAVGVAFSSPARIVAGLGGLLLLGVLGVLIAVLVSLEGTRAEIETTRAKLSETEARVQQLSSGFDPLLAAAAPLTGADGQRDIRRIAGQVATAAGLIPGLAGDTTRVVDAALGIAGEVEGAGLAQTLEAGRTFAEVATPALADLAPQLTLLLDQLDVLQILPGLRGQVSEIRSALVDSLATQVETRALTERTVALFEESLAIQRETLVHVRSIDEKTLGTAPTAVTP